MRLIALLSLAFILSACADQPTEPDTGLPDGPELARGDAAATTAPVTPITVFASAPRSLGYTEGDVFRYPNRPEPDIGADHVVWQWRASPYYGPATMNEVRLSTGARTEVATGQLSGPLASGRYSAWNDSLNAIVVRNHVTGELRRIEGQAPQAYTAEIAGDRIAFSDAQAGTLELVDLRTGERRVITTHGYDKRYGDIRYLGFDGRYVVWTADRRLEQYGAGIAYFDTQTGEEGVAVPFTSDGMTGIAVDAGRVVYSQHLGDRQPIFMHDLATGQTRQISSDAPRAQTFPRISGDFVVWDDTRTDQHPAYVYNHDVYLYDLVSGTEIPLVAGPEWEGTPRIEGNRVVYTERRNNRWEVMVVELAPASIAGLRDELRRMVASRAVRNAGMAHSLETYLSHAATAQEAGNRARAEHWLRKFIDQVRRQGRRQIEASAARRLEGMAAGVIARM